MIISLRIGVGSHLSFVYIFLSFRCVIAFLMYSVVFSNMIVFPLSALLMTILVHLVLFFFLVRLSPLFCLRLHSFMSSSLILHSAGSNCLFSFLLSYSVRNGSLFVVFV